MQQLNWIAIPIAYVVATVFTVRMTGKLGHNDSKETEHVQLQTRQDIAGIYGTLVISNGLLAAILAAISIQIFR
jgi:hypothetical protein